MICLDSKFHVFLRWVDKGDEQKFAEAVTLLHQKNKKIVLSIGGITYNQLWASAVTNTDTFASNAKTFIDKYGLDGVDIDYGGLCTAIVFLFSIFLFRLKCVLTCRRDSKRQSERERERAEESEYLCVCVCVCVCVCEREREKERERERERWGGEGRNKQMLARLNISILFL